MENKASYTFQEIKQKLVNYCVYQDRCHSEVEQKMREFLLIDEAKEDIFLYLIQENYLNEERFVRSYIRGKFYMKKWGRQKIKMSLKQKGISERMMQGCWNEIFEEDYADAIRTIYNKYIENLSGLNDYQKKTKAIRHLLSKGFEYEDIQNNVGNL